MRERAEDLITVADAAVPVPLHRSRLRSRGFNQAVDLARGLGIPVVRALHRTRATPTQTSLPAAQRHRNVRDAFVATRRARPLAGRTALLVDDVSTTGATLEACARALKRAGIATVLAVTAARVVNASGTDNGPLP
jgi:ComF family protein